MKFTTAVFCAVAMSMLGMTAHAGGPENLWENTCRLNAAGKGSKYACFESQDGPLIYQAGSTENDYYLPGADDDNHWAVVLGKEHHQFGEFQFATKGWGVHVKNSKIPGCVNYQLTRVFGDDNVVLNKKWCRGERDAVIPDSQPSSGPEDFYNNFCEKGLAPRDTKLACFVSNDGPVVQGAGSTKDDYRFDSPDTHDSTFQLMQCKSNAARRGRY